MAEDRWRAVDVYLDELLHLEDDALRVGVAAADAAGLPPIQVSAPYGKLLHVLALVAGARRILEIGTLGGYSGTWLARALPPGGRLVTLELDPRHAEVARESFERAGVADRIEIRVGRAVDSLAALVAENTAPFDLVFIDADKPTYPEYLEWSLRLSRPGTVIVADNVVRRGAIADPGAAPEWRGRSDDENVAAVRRFIEMLARDPRVSATVVQTVGAKGYDGFALAIVVTAS